MKTSVVVLYKMAKIKKWLSEQNNHKNVEKSDLEVHFILYFFFKVFKI